MIVRRILAVAGISALAATGMAMPAQASVATDVAQQNAVDGKHRWMVATYTNGNFSCGGSVIDPNWVITAKHCFRGTAPETVTVRLDSTRRDSGGQVVGVSQVVLHPNSKVDFALLKLDRPVSVPTLKIGAPARAYKKGAKAVTMGWGTKSEKSSTRRVVLRWTNQRITANSGCGGGKNGVFCAGRPHNAGAGTCTGDSGGPLIWGTGGIRKDGTPIGTPYLLGTLRGLNNHTCYRKGRNDDWQSVRTSVTWIKRTIAQG